MWSFLAVHPTGWGSRRALRSFTTLAVLLAPCALAACGGTTSHSVAYVTPSLTLPDTVAVHVWPYPKLPDRPYQVVGEVAVEGEAGLLGRGVVDRQKLLAALKDDARRMGADGILSLMAGTKGVTLPGVDQAWFWGIAVKLTDVWTDRKATERRRQELERRELERLNEESE